MPKKILLLLISTWTHTTPQKDPILVLFPLILLIISPILLLIGLFLHCAYDNLINYTHLNRLKNQASYQKLRSYTKACKWGCCHTSSYKITLHLYNIFSHYWRVFMHGIVSLLALQTSACRLLSTTCLFIDKTWCYPTITVLLFSSSKT